MCCGTSCRARIETEREQQTRDLAVMLGRRRYAAADPVEQFGVRNFEQRGEIVEGSVVEPCEVSCGERAEDDRDEDAVEPNEPA